MLWPVDLVTGLLSPFVEPQELLFLLSSLKPSVSRWHALFGNSIESSPPGDVASAPPDKDPTD